MVTQSSRYALYCTIVWAAAFAGCAGAPVVRITHTLDAAIAIDAEPAEIYVGPFIGRTPADDPWARRARGALITALPNDPAARASRSFTVTGSVAVDSRLIRAGGDDAVAQMRRRCTVEIAFDVTGGDTGATVATRTIRKDFNITGPEAKDDGPLIETLVDLCTAYFASMLQEHEFNFTVPLAADPDEAVGRGNQLAAAGEYRQALQAYKQASEAAPPNVAAIFNAAVMHEALGNLIAAEVGYNRAFELSGRDRYEQALARIRKLRRLQSGA